MRGTSTTLSVVATGTNLTYQWYKSDPSGGAYVAAGTTSSITVTPSGSVSNYYVVVSNACGTIQSSTASITTVACMNAAITQQPSSYTIQPGGSANFTVGATGTNLHYQWYKSDPAGSTYVAVTGGTSSSLTIVPASAQANYCVKVWSDCGSVVTSVTVTASFSCTPVFITSQSQSTTINNGDMTILSVSASGTSMSDPTHYAWWQSTDAIHYYTISSAPSVQVAPGMTTYYYCVVSNNCNNTTSNVISVTVVSGSGVMAGQPRLQTPKLHAGSMGIASGTLAPVITAQPLSISVPPGNTGTLSVAADSGTFQWYASMDGETYQPIPNAIDPILNIQPTALTYYFARVTNEWAALNSEVATVIVAPVPLATPVVQTATQEVSFTPGAPVSLEVRASGTNLHYQWYKSDPTGAAFAPLGDDAPRVTDTPAGPEAVYVVRITNDAAFIDTQLIVARSTACVSPTITVQPQAAVVHAGGATTLQVNATGTGTLSYQWFGSDAAGTGWIAVSNATAASINLSPDETHFYYCVVTSSCGNSVTSNTVAVQVTP